jgi:1-deoxy-D-xylulose-5-phosphate reductoisomerase
MTGVAILGSTGSIGCTALDLLRRHSDRFHVVALTAGSNADLLERQVEEWRPTFHGLVNGGGGPACLVEAAAHPDADIVLNAVVGAAGLEATLAALRAGRRVALANKESLVMAGELMLSAVREGGGELVPVDSEHSAVLQCLTGAVSPCSRLTLTASGGPFRTWPAERVREASVSEALQHPTWQMGRKITVDSATLANKALEVIEAHFLFALGFECIDVVVHPQSIVHSLVEFADGSVLAQLGWPSMELPILYALTHPERVPDDGVRRFDPTAAPALTFEPVRADVFRAFASGVEAGRAGGTAPAVFNAANEVAVEAFLQERIGFGKIADVVGRVLDEHHVSAADSLDAVLEADEWARQRAAHFCEVS